MAVSDALSERPPTKDEVKQASDAMQALAGALTPSGELPFSVRKDGDLINVELSPSVGQLVLEVLAHVARGEMVTFVPYGAVLSTKEAADLLNVSRPFLVKLLEQDEIDHHRVGSHRRVKAVDVLAYKRRRDNERRSGLKKLQELGQAFDAS